MDNEEQKEQDVIVDDDSDLELDKLINETIAGAGSQTQKAEHEDGVPSKTVEFKEEIPESTDVSKTAVETPSQEAQTDEKNPSYDLRVPVKGPLETEESYAVRLQISEMLKKRETAATEDEKSEVQKELKKFREEFGHLINSNRSQFSQNRDDAPSNVQPDDGSQRKFVSVDELDEILAEKQIQTENKFIIDSFFSKHPEFTDQNVRDVFVDFFDSNYKIDGKSGTQIAQVLELARSAMFKPTQSIEERVLKGANVQNKVNAMQFPGGTIVRNGLTPDQQKSVDEMKAAGISEDRARELILE
jgi:hypothetical protein